MKKFIRWFYGIPDVNLDQKVPTWDYLRHYGIASSGNYCIDKGVVTCII